MTYFYWVVLWDFFYPFVFFLNDFFVFFFDTFLHLASHSFHASYLIFVDKPIIAEYSRFLFFVLLNKRHSLLNIVKTERRCNINSLTNIETMWKTSMVSFEKCIHIFAGFLVGFVDWNTVTYYFQRIDHKSNSVE